MLLDIPERAEKWVIPLTICSVWYDLKNDPVRWENLRLRSKFPWVTTDTLKECGLTQQ